MAKLAFARATKKKARFRGACIGPAGSGKTMTALRIACALGPRVALIDTEHGSASKYADLETDDGVLVFDTLELESFAPAMYVQAIETAEDAGYDALVIDSLSHAWMGKDGALEQVDRKAASSSSGNSYTAWRDVTPQHNALVEAMLACRAHLIVTMRTKTEYVLEENEKGKKVPKKVGLQPVQRDGLEYEFDVVGDLNLDNVLSIGKTRCPALHGRVFPRAGANVATILRQWLTDGAPAIVSPVDDFIARFGAAADSAAVEALIAEVQARRGDFNEAALQRVRRAAATAKARTSPPAEAPKQQAPNPSQEAAQ